MDLDLSLIVDNTTGLESLSTTLLDCLNTHVQTGHEEDRTVLQHYTLGRATWKDVQPIVHDRMWKGKNAIVAFEVQRQLCLHVLESRTTQEQVWPAILLVWGLSQSWGKQVKVPTFMKHWRENTMKTWATTIVSTQVQDSANSLRGACAFLEHFLALDHIAKRQDPRSHIAKALLRETPSWPVENLREAPLTKFIVPLGLLVERVSQPEEHATLFKKWTQYVQAVFHKDKSRLIAAMQMSLSLDIMESTLPDAYKRVALLTASPMIWSMNAPQLRPLLAQDEAERFAMLPWATCKNPERLEDWEKENPISTNKDTVRHYCPDLYPLLQMAVNEDDWCLKDRIAVWVNQSATAQIAPAEQTPLPRDFLEP